MVKSRFLSPKWLWILCLVVPFGACALVMQPPTNRTTMWLVGTLIRNSGISERKKGEYLQRYLRKGMSTEEVELLLGNPLLAESFASGPIGTLVEPQTSFWYPRYGLTVYLDSAGRVDH